MAEPAAEHGTDFVAFVRANTASLLRTAYLLTGEAAAAEDLVQENFARLISRWPQVQAAQAPLAYARQAMVNLYMNQTRRLWRGEVAVERVPERVVETDASGSADDRDELGRLLSGLPQRQRAALVLRYYHDQTDGEIAATLNCRPGTVRSLLSRGLATLREEVKRND
jgi:RNA polymerase sigma-70 factor (sigma-E family)